MQKFISSKKLKTALIFVIVLMIGTMLFGGCRRTDESDNPATEIAENEILLKTNIVNNSGAEIKDLVFVSGEAEVSLESLAAGDTLSMELIYDTEAKNYNIQYVENGKLREYSLSFTDDYESAGEVNIECTKDQNNNLIMRAVVVAEEEASFDAFLIRVDDIVWGIPLIALILIVGLLLTLRSRGVQFRHLGKALKFAFKDETDGAGEVSSFGALCTALSATIGTGNIVGVATAVCASGPGALFWMEVAALLGMATKYAEGLLAVKYREINEEGKVLGGPFYYIEKGLGKGWKWMAVLFAIFGLLAGLLGIGTITQVNGIASAVQNFFDPAKTSTVSLFGNAYPTATVIAGFIVTVCVALVIIGGLKRIARVSEIIVPFMAVLYVLCGLTIIIFNITKIPAAVVTIIQGAFNPAAVTGGVVGTIFIAMQKGIARGIFSNEAGLGSAPIAAAAARTNEPVRQGLVCMTGTFIDTIIVCTITGLAIVLTGAWLQPGLEGAAVTTYAFRQGMPFFNSNVSAFLLMMCLAFFAFTTILGWDYYSERCLQYLVGDKKAVLIGYKILYIIAVFVGPYLTVSAVWTIADIVNGLMAFPNVVALILLSGVVAKETKDYITRYKKQNLK